jgi:hypothetical protein
MSFYSFTFFFLLIFSTRFLNFNREWKVPRVMHVALSMHVDPHSNKGHTTSTVHILHHCLQNWLLLSRAHTSAVSGNKTETPNRVTPKSGPLRGSVALM